MTGWVSAPTAGAGAGGGCQAGITVVDSCGAAMSVRSAGETGGAGGGGGGGAGATGGAGWAGGADAPHAGWTAGAMTEPVPPRRAEAAPWAPEQRPAEAPRSAVLAAPAALPTPGPEPAATRARAERRRQAVPTTGPVRPRVEREEPRQPAAAE